MRLFKSAIASALAAILIAGNAPAESSVQGKAQVIDGDTVRVGGVKVRLNGVDAPEMNYQAGRASKVAMRHIVGNQTITCALNGDRTYDRLVGICYLPNGTDIGAELIRQGHALDCQRYSGGRYRKLEMPGARTLIRQAPYC